jgi:excisionase family DNA binding protein
MSEDNPGTAPADEDLPVLLSIAEVARFFDRSPRTIRRWVAAGDLAAIRVGPALYFDRDTIRRQLRDQITDAVLGSRAGRGPG